MEIEYVSASIIRTGVETHPPQLHNLLYFAPTLPSLTFCVLPSLSYDEPMMLKYLILRQAQSNPVNTDGKRAIKSVRVYRVWLN